jgi:hypothetical protein
MEMEREQKPRVPLPVLLEESRKLCRDSRQLRRASQEIQRRLQTLYAAHTRRALEAFLTRAGLQEAREQAAM